MHFGLDIPCCLQGNRPKGSLGYLPIVLWHVDDFFFKLSLPLAFQECFVLTKVELQLQSLARSVSRLSCRDGSID
jgi:hypothetical protein